MIITAILTTEVNAECVQHQTILFDAGNATLTGIFLSQFYHEAIYPQKSQQLATIRQSTY